MEIEIVPGNSMKTCIVFLQRLSPTEILNILKKIDKIKNMSVRRRSSPDVVKKLWTCIKTIKDQRQIPNQERIVHHMIRKYDIPEEQTLIQLHYCVEEGLIRFTLSNGTRGSKTDVPQEAYRLPKEKLVQDTHDWYCWKCHKPGKVITCSTCFRVYHLDCIKNFEDVTSNFVCEVCFDIFNDEEDIPRRELNRLLRFSCLRLMQILVVKTPKDNTILPETEGSSDYESDSDDSSEQLIDLSNDDWQIDFLNFKFVDLKMMENKVIESGYVNLADFRAEAETILHNTIIMFGADSVEAKSVQYMVEECRRDVREIRLCKDCFRESNLKRCKDWFCIPCKPPHQLVYAKQKGYSFWPAKVLKKDNDNYDVRFFGGSHTRAIVPERNIRSIKECIFKLVKRNESWNRAYFELLRHQEQLLEDNDNMDIVLPNYILKSMKMIKGEYFPIRKGKETLLNRSLPNKKKSLKRNNQVKRNRSASLHCIRTNGRVKRQKHNSCCSSNDGSSTSIPTLHSPKPTKSINNGHATTFTKKKNRSDEENRTKRLKKDRRSQGSRPGLNVKSFDPNALQEEMGKFLLEDIHELQLTETPIKLENSLVPLLEETSPSSCISPELGVENLNQLVNISDQESSHSRDAIPELKNTRTVNNSKEVRYLKMKIAKQKAKYEKEINKLKRLIINQKTRHKRKIREIKKYDWCQECLKQASYYCCFNTSYCSPTCQRKHWKNHRDACQHAKTN